MVVLFIVVAVDQVEFNENIIIKKKYLYKIKNEKKNQSQEKHNIEQHKAKRYLIIDL